jgi:hypothetical protein
VVVGLGFLAHDVLPSPPLGQQKAWRERRDSLYRNRQGRQSRKLFSRSRPHVSSTLRAVN